MRPPFAHAMMLQPDCDGLARQNFIAGLKMHMEDRLRTSCPISNAPDATSTAMTPSMAETAPSLLRAVGACIRSTMPSLRRQPSAATNSRRLQLLIGAQPTRRSTEEDWNLGPFLYLGGEPGKPMPPLGEKLARHTKGDATGEKKERPKLREVNKSRFTKLETVEQVWAALFGIA